MSHVESMCKNCFLQKSIEYDTKDVKYFAIA
jgi:hypothetical protein